MSSRNKDGSAVNGHPGRQSTRPAHTGHAPRVHSNELLGDGAQLIIEHAGREYRLQVTRNGRLILTA